MSNVYDILLTIALPHVLEEEVLDYLASVPEWVRGFTIVRAEGFGAGAKLASAMEQVRGRSRRHLVQILMHSDDVSPLVEGLRTRFTSDEMAWWTVPLSGFGRLS